MFQNAVRRLDKRCCDGSFVSLLSHVLYGIISFDLSFGLGFVLDLLLGIVAGLIGGIITVNVKRKAIHS
jgi:hypothetical protein